MIDFKQYSDEELLKLINLAHKEFEDRNKADFHKLGISTPDAWFLKRTTAEILSQLSESGIKLSSIALSAYLISKGFTNKVARRGKNITRVWVKE